MRHESSFLGWEAEGRLARALRKAQELHEASWDPHSGPLMLRGQPSGRYTRSQHECIREVVGDDPIALILDCLFTAGFAEMWDFCDQVLGPEAEGRKPSETGEG